MTIKRSKNRNREVNRDDSIIEATGFTIGNTDEFQIVKTSELPRRRGGRGASSIVARLAAVVKTLAVLERGLPPAESGIIKLSKDTIAELPLRDPVPYIAKWLAREVKRRGWHADIGTAKDPKSGEKVITVTGRLPGVA